MQLLNYPNQNPKNRCATLFLKSVKYLNQNNRCDTLLLKSANYLNTYLIIDKNATWKSVYARMTLQIVLITNNNVWQQQ